MHPACLPILSVSIALSSTTEHPVKPAGGGVAGSSCGCPADFNQSGSIDASDLGVLLAGWGTPARDLNGDGTTDSADLGILLSVWGPCVAIPPNDLCEDALPLFEGDTYFCTVGANTDGPAYTVSSGCIEFGYNSMTSDIWYDYTAPGAGTVTISTCGVGWDTRLAAYANVFSQTVGCPGEGFNLNVLVACNDDAPGCGTGSQITFLVLPGKQYRIRVGGYLGWSGEGDLHVDFDPVGSTCATAINLGTVDFESHFDTTLDVDDAADESPCAFGDTAAKWFKIFPKSCFGVPILTASTCHPLTNFDTTISVWKADPSGCIGEFVGCNDDFVDPACQLDGQFRKSKVTFDAPTTSFYYVRVSGFNGAKGDFLLQFSWECD